MDLLHVAFRVGDADYAIAAASVLHLESFETATHVPGAPPYVVGLVQVRGRVIPVVDLRNRFGLPPVERTLDHRIVVVQVGARVAGLLVDSARDVLKIDAASLAKPPELVEQQATGLVTHVAMIGKRMFLIVDPARLIGEELTQ